MPGNPRITVSASAHALDGSFPGDLGIELIEIDDDSVAGRLIVDRRHLHPGGYVHGGVWVAFADTVAAWGTMRNLPPGTNFTTAELKLNVFAAGMPRRRAGGPRSSRFTAGRSTQVWEVRVSKGERLAANFVCTQTGAGRRTPTGSPSRPATRGWLQADSGRSSGSPSSSMSTLSLKKQSAPAIRPTSARGSA